MAAESKKNGGNGSQYSSSSSSYSSIGDEIFGRKDDSSRSLGLRSSSSPPSSGGYFSTVFPPATGVMGNNSPHSDLYRALNKCGHAGASAGSKSQGSSTTRGETAQKDERSIFVNEQSESSYFGSSVHYGGRDFYISSSTQASRKTYKPDDADEVDDKNAANRGEWWQGSFYY